MPGLDTQQPGLWAPATGPNTLSVAGAVSSNRAYANRFVCPKAMTITKIGFNVTTAAGANDPVDVGIYNSTLTTLLGSSGSTLGMLNSLGNKQVPLQTPVALVAGQVYYVAWSSPAPSGSVVQVVLLALPTANAAYVATMFGAAAPAVEFGIVPGGLFPLSAPFTLSGLPTQTPILALLQ